MQQAKTVHISNVSCGHCIKTIEREISSITGVTDVEIDQPSKNATITWDEPATWQLIQETLDEIGYPADH